MQCPATIKSGTQCSRKVEENKNYCWQHSNTEGKTELIKDLIDLKNQYLDPISYLKLIALKPEEFNPKLITGIIENYEAQFPLTTFLGVYNLAEQYANSWTDMDINFGRTKLDPLYISSIILRKISIEGESISSVDDTSPREYIYNEVKNKVVHKEDLLIEYMEHVVEHPEKYISDQTIISKITKMNELFFSGDDEKYEVYNVLDILYNVWKKLKKVDPSVFDTSDLSTYSEKLIATFIVLIHKVQI